MNTFIIVNYLQILFSFIITFKINQCSNNYQITYPYIINKKYLNRIRRNIPDDESIISIKVADWILKLNLINNVNSNLIVDPNLKCEWITLNETIVRKINNFNQCIFTLGIVEASKLSSLVALTICRDKYWGYINIKGKDYFLEPLLINNDIDNAHILYEEKIRMKRSLDLHSYWMFNLTGDIIDLDELSHRKLYEPLKEENEYHPEWYEEIQYPDEIGYFVDTVWTTHIIKSQEQVVYYKNNNLPPRWLEIALAIDYTLILFHGKDKIEQYILALMNIVNAIYQDSSLESNMKLVITRILLYENKKQSVIRPGNAKKSLENVNSWNHRLHISLAPNESRHDVALWITRLDIGGPSGYAPVGGACDSKRSCALIRDEGLTSAFIIAHEMAHILGLNHDGDKKNGNKCEDDAFKGSVMAPMVAATFNKFTWSYCSKEEFQKNVRKWSCLFNPPTKQIGEIILNDTLEKSFTMDEQCRMEFGEGYILCRAFDIVEPCSHLWCGNIKSPLVCKTKKGPPLEGTQCGFNKWCINGYCKLMDEKSLTNIPAVVSNPQNGGWSDWTFWGPCSRSCGTGVKFRTRKCNNPMPKYGGIECNGSNEEWKTCNLRSCPIFGDGEDVRAHLCKNLPKLLNIKNQREANFTWLPYESDDIDKKCKLICISKESKEIFETLENLIDGTPCSYENVDNICIQGVCQIVGCDGNLFSNLTTDSCGVCGGNNTDCSTVRSVFDKILKREISRVAVIPRMARKINIEANITTLNDVSELSVAFILKNRRKRKYTIGIPNQGNYTEILQGTKFYYKKHHNIHKIWANGPVSAEMIVLLYVPMSQINNGVNVLLKYNYITNKKALLNSSSYNWILGGWGPCSVSCGGGKRQQTIACWDKQNLKLVRRKFCSLLGKPSIKTTKCNTFDCNFKWIPAKWEPCSTSCGLNGIQQRQIYCIPQAILKNNSINSIITSKPWRFMVNSKKCSEIGPVTERPCNRKPCISYWTFEPWSKCSVTCGSGIQTRLSTCRPPGNETFFTCEGLPLEQKRYCKIENNLSTNLLCKKMKLNNYCKGDESKYCTINLLSIYCKIGGFRKLCCKSCSNFKLSPISS